MMTTRRTALTRLAALGLGATPLLAAAQGDAAAWPTRPIKLMVGFPPGGSTDGPVRVLAESAGRILKQPIVVENKTGAGGTMPAVALQTAAPDGYTLGISSLGMYRLPYTTDNRWSPDADITHIVGLTGYAFGFAVPADSPFKTWADYVAAAKAAPGKLSVSHAQLDLSLELLNSKAGMQLLLVPYKGGGPATTDAISGQVNMVYALVPVLLPHIQSGKLKPLAVTSSKRFVGLPNVPTFTESGVDFDMTMWYGIFTPAGTPKAVIDKLAAATRKVMSSPELAESIRAAGADPLHNTPDEFRAQLRKEHTYWQGVAKAIPKLVQKQ